VSFGVFILTRIEGGRMDQAVREFGTIDEALGTVREIVLTQATEWKAITLIDGKDMPLMLEGAFPTPPEASV
jgi:hypothetical protein